MKLLAMAIKKKKDSSLVVAIKSVKSGECDACFCRKFRSDSCWWTGLNWKGKKE